MACTAGCHPEENEESRGIPQPSGGACGSADPRNTRTNSGSARPFHLPSSFVPRASRGSLCNLRKPGARSVYSVHEIPVVRSGATRFRNLVHGSSGAIHWAWSRYPHSLRKRLLRLSRNLMKASGLRSLVRVPNASAGERSVPAPVTLFPTFVAVLPHRRRGLPSLTQGVEAAPETAAKPLGTAAAGVLR
jgi:hypothetical protein